MTGRSPAVAGRFYPADPETLALTVDRLLDSVPEAAPEPGERAYVVPHAGYRYSGFTAAQVYARLRSYAGSVHRVVLVGPAHYVPLNGCAVPAATRWSTPLGELAVDVVGVQALAAAGHAAIDDAPHAPEHALEVQLPFLQRVLPEGVPVLPIAVGRSAVEDMVATLAAAVAADPRRTVVLCSTDLSHYLDDETARRQDARTVQAVLDLAPERLSPADACGIYALRALLAWARPPRPLTPTLLHLCTSADSTADRTRVVGYAALAFRDPSHPPPAI